MKINFGQMMLQTARNFSDREALVNVERNRRFTFMELHLLTNRICNMMRDRFDMGFGDVYTIILDNDNASLLSAWMYKGVATGAWLNYRESYEEHVWQIDWVSPKLAFLEAELVEKYYPLLRDRGCEIVCMDKPPVAREGLHYFWDLVDEASDAETDVEYESDEHFPLYRFTGGTTGKGKCATYTTGNCLAHTAQIYGAPENYFHSGTRHVHITPMTHASFLIVLPVFFKGGTSITLNLPDLQGLCETFQQEQATSSLLVPTLLYRFLENDFHAQYDLTSLETIFYGASPMSPTRLLQLKEKFGNIFAQFYGSTEAMGISTLSKRAHEGTTEAELAKLKSAGRPFFGVELKIMDDDGKEVAQGQTGEICVRSRSVIKGYFRNPEQTATEFVDGYWKSGDLGYIDEAGRVYIVDRKKDMIITGGFNVYAIEVEAGLNAHDAVLMSAVVGIPHEEWGEAVHAEVILKEGAQAEPAELIDFCKEKLGRFKSPKSVAFVQQLPTSSVGKVLRRDVREKYWAGQERAVS